MSAFVLRSIAAITMIIDHIGLCFGIFPFRVIGRLAFPLYVFLLVNGFRHTRSRQKYAIRLAICAVVSQIPFQLMRYSGLRSWSIFFTEPTLFFDKFNVMATLLMALLVIWLGEFLRSRKETRWFCLLPTIAAFFLYHYGVLDSDYGARGILLATVFWLFDGKKLLIALGLFVSMFYPTMLHYAYTLLHGGALLPPGAWDLAQLAIFLTLPLIYFYNGKSGMPRIKGLKTAFYAIYPVHMLILWAIVQFGS